jgi:nitrogen fixation-related uncharacterized protein
MDYEVLGPFVIAMLMSLGALCIFVWAVLSGAFNGADEAALRCYHTEVENDAARERTPAG